MADEQPIASPPPAENAAGDAAAAAADDKKKAAPAEPIKIIEKPEPVNEPSEAEKNKGVEACKARIAAADKRINDIKATLDRLAEGRKSHGDTSGALRTELKQLRDDFKALREQRTTLFNQVTAANDARKQAQSKLREIQKSLRGNSIPDIEKQIAAIEYEMSTSTLSLKDEKAKMLEIKTLKQSIEQVKHMQTLSTSVASTVVPVDEEQIKAMHQQVKDLDQQITAKRTREKEVAAQLDALREKFQNTTGGAQPPELIKERKALQEKKKEEFNAMRALEEKYKQEAYAFRKYQRDLNTWKRQEQHLKYLDRVKEREERKKEREKEDDESNYKHVPTHPWADEIFTCDDLIKYCKKQIPKEKSQSAKKTFDVKATAVDKGLVALVRNDEDVEFAGDGKKKKKGGAAAAAAVASSDDAAASAAVEDKKLKLSIDAYSGFLKVGVAPPSLASQCAATVQALQQAKDRFQRLTEADKKKAKDAAAAAAAKAKEDAKKAAKARTSNSDVSGAAGVPAAAEVAEPTIDYRKAIRGVKGAHV